MQQLLPWTFKGHSSKLCKCAFFWKNNKLIMVDGRCAANAAFNWDCELVFTIISRLNASQTGHELENRSCEWTGDYMKHCQFTSGIVVVINSSHKMLLFLPVTIFIFVIYHCLQICVSTTVTSAVNSTHSTTQTPDCTTASFAIFI